LRESMGDSVLQRKARAEPCMPLGPRALRGPKHSPFVSRLQQDPIQRPRMATSILMRHLYPFLDETSGVNAVDACREAQEAYVQATARFRRGHLRQVDEK